MTIIYSILLVIAGILWSNFLEWVFHQIPLHTMHKLTKDKESLLWFHMIHHKKVTKTNYSDYGEIDKFLIADAISLIILAVIHYFICVTWLGLPWLYVGNIIGVFLFAGTHWGSHIYPEIGKKYLSWHYDHHIHYPDYNHCVSLPIFDILFGTYKKYKENDEKQRIT